MTRQEKEEIVQELIVRLRDGDPVYNITQDYITNGLDEWRVKALLGQANAVIKREADEIRDNIVDHHLLRYELIYAANVKIKEMVAGYGEDAEAAKPYVLEENFKLIASKLMTSLSALKSKEKIMGLTNKGVKVVVSDTKVEIVNDSVKIERGGFNLNNLTIDELYELRTLLDQCRIDPLEGVFPLDIMKTTNEIVIEQREEDLSDGADMSSPIEQFVEQDVRDIEYEDMTEEEKYDKNLDTLKQKAGNINDVKDSLNETFLKLAKKKFK